MYREFDLIERIAQTFARPDGVALGIGDDCAVLEPAAFDLVTTDTMVEGVHFRRDFSSADDVGYKAASVSLSDVAAMGGRPGAFFLNLSFAKDEDEAFVDGLLSGIKEACDEAGISGGRVSLAGGDVTSTRGPAMITTTLLGTSPADGPLTRDGARPGDHIVLFGPTGLAQAGLELLLGHFDVERDDFAGLLRAHRRPHALVEEGVALGEAKLPSALIDLSDGLVQDLGHILERSAVGAVVDTTRLMRHDELTALCEQTGADILDFMLSGGEDLQLCMTLASDKMDALDALASRHGWTYRDIGEIRPADEGLCVLGPDGEPIEVETHGYQHFSDR